MKKGYLKICVFAVLSLFVNMFFTYKVSAANASISVSFSKSTVVVGGTFTATVTVSSSSSIGAWEYNLNYDSSKLTLTGGSAPHVADYASSSGKKSASYSYTFKAKASGNASVSIGNYSVVGWDEQAMSTSGGSKSVKIITQKELEDSYSKNNNLSSLKVEGASLAPAFNKNTLEYSIELEPETTSINISATAEDKKSKISGAGTVNVSEGDNKIEVKVTAENGSIKTYIINANVKELSPINVKIKGKEYTVVRKKDALKSPTNYNETTVKINGEDVPAFKSDVTKFLLVGLKDDKGNIDLYIYDEKEKTYTLYNEVTFNKVVLYPLEVTKDIKIPEGYKKYTEKLRDKKVEVYKLKSNSKFALIYGMNVETGKKHLYMYDKTEETLQIYNDEEIKMLNDKINNYSMLILGLGILSGVLALILIIVCIKKLSKNKKKKVDIQYLDAKKIKS